MNAHQVQWKVVPVSGYQQLDVRPDDLINEGDFRKCDTYRGGGGYDQFPAICEKRLGLAGMNHQFVPQLYGCTLDCPYCYVTRSGVYGSWKPYTSSALVEVFLDSGQDVFHLMGGAPALYLDDWMDIIKRLPSYAVFHSDFLLNEGKYTRSTLELLAQQSNCLFAVDVKGTDPANYLANTRLPFNADLFWPNFTLLRETGVNFYVTFTAPNPDTYKDFAMAMTDRLGSCVMDDAFTIDLVDYEAMPYTDIRPVREERACHLA